MRLNHRNLSFAERAAVVFVFTLLSFAPAQAQSKPVNATIDTSKTEAPISKYIYGQFLEHGGDSKRGRLGGDAGRPQVLLSDYVEAARRTSGSRVETPRSATALDADRR